MKVRICNEISWTHWQYFTRRKGKGDPLKSFYELSDVALRRISSKAGWCGGVRVGGEIFLVFGQAPRKIEHGCHGLNG